MISYSLKAKRALAYFFRPYNDLDIYVEDTNCMNFYVIFINRILNGTSKVNRIFPLGGKDQVIDACQKDQNNKDKRPRIYIIDGDLDCLLNRDIPKLDRLYRLKVYCAENLIICEESVHQIGIEWMPNADSKTITARINYNGFIETIESDLLELFFVYALAFITDSSIETVGYHVNNMCDSANGPSKLNSSMVEQRKKERNYIQVK